MIVPPQNKRHPPPKNALCQQGTQKKITTVEKGLTRRSKNGEWQKNDTDHQILKRFHEFWNFSSYRFWPGACSQLTHKILCMFSGGIDLHYTTISWTYSQNPLSFPAEVDLRYTTIILLTKSFVASSGSRFEIHNDNFTNKILCQTARKVSKHEWKYLENRMQHDISCRFVRAFWDSMRTQKQWLCFRHH